MSEQADLRYPIGKWVREPYSEKSRDALMTDIRFLPRQLEYAILNLDEAQLRTPYRDGGWTLRQVIHHVADSHMNAYIRFKWGLTESKPIIKPYDEAKWAQLPDTEHVPINVSLTLLHALHARWHELMKHFTAADWDKSVVHPEHGREFTLWDLLGMYAWHGRHHTAHVTSLRERMGW
jgi:uncharacterized damage-inducible protein DinB